MQMPNLGARVYVRPTAPNIQDGHGMYGRFMLATGRWIIVDEWWAARLRDGSVALDNEDVAPGVTPEG